MDLPIREIFNTYRTSDLARAMCLPVSTVHTWKQDGIPGAKAPPDKRGPYEMRIQRLLAAAASLKKSKKRKRPTPLREGSPA